MYNGEPHYDAQAEPKEPFVRYSIMLVLDKQKCRRVDSRQIKAELRYRNTEEVANDSSDTVLGWVRRNSLLVTTEKCE